MLLATAHWTYLFGALYLFFINGVFITLATFLVVRRLPLPRHAFVSRQRARRVEWSIWAVAVLTAGPSVYLAAGIVRATVFTHNARQFVDEQFAQPGTYVVTRRLEAGERRINVLLAGQRYRPAQLQAARARLPRYHLAGATLLVRQGLARLDSADAQSLRANLLDDLRSRNEQALAGYDARLAQLQAALAHADSAAAAAARPAAPALPAATALLREVQAEHPAVRRLGLSRLVQPAASNLPADTAVVVAVQVRPPLPAAEQQRLSNWLRLRLGSASPVRLLVTAGTPTKPKAH